MNPLHFINGLLTTQASIIPQGYYWKMDGSLIERVRNIRCHPPLEAPDGRRAADHLPRITLRDNGRTHNMIQILIIGKGASIYYVRKIFGILDPLRPCSLFGLNHKTKFMQPRFLRSLLGTLPPPPLCERNKWIAPTNRDQVPEFYLPCRAATRWGLGGQSFS